MEGNRKQAKYAVSAIAAMTADSGLKALSVLYGVSWCWRWLEHNGIFCVRFLLVIAGHASVDKCDGVGGVFWQRLVDKLEDNTHLPTVLQSLGCIAQNAMPIFETREDDIIKFVVRNVLRRPNPQVRGCFGYV